MNAFHNSKAKMSTAAAIFYLANLFSEEYIIIIIINIKYHFRIVLS